MRIRRPLPRTACYTCSRIGRSGSRHHPHRTQPIAASHHAQHNPNAMMRNRVTVEEVLASPLIADPLHRLDCCVVSDGGGAVIVASPEIARSINRPRISVRGAGESAKGLGAGRVDITSSAGIRSGKIAFEEARVAPTDIKYASIYDSFTITVVIQLEDLGFCEKGKGGPLLPTVI
jgi:acetyl-CoA C-acetyltransferase